MDCLKKVLQIWCIYLRKMYILEIFPLLLLLIKKEVRTIGFVFCGARPDSLCLNSTATPAPNTFLAEILFKNVKYSQYVKTLRVEEIRPDPVKREGCLLEIASKVVISEICSNGQRWGCCCNFKDEMVAMAHYFSCSCCSRLLWSLQKTFQSLDFSSPRLFAFLRSFESLWWGISCGWSRKNPTLNCCDKCILKPFQTLILSSFWEFWKFRIKDHLKPINVKNKTFQQFYSLRKITNLAAKTF